MYYTRPPRLWKTWLWKISKYGTMYKQNLIELFSIFLFCTLCMFRVITYLLKTRPITAMCMGLSFCHQKQK